MVSFHLVKIAALLCTNSVVALPPTLESLTKKNKLTKKMIKEDDETMALLNKQITEMTRLMDQVKSTYEEKLSKISSLLEYTAGSCCDVSNNKNISLTLASNIIPRICLPLLIRYCSLRRSPLHLRQN